ncbi:MAG: GPW/gp25 family protein [Pararhodobacter sp.]
MAGIDRRTGRPAGNLASAFQSVEVIFSTRLGERIMRREFGAGLAELLGRLATRSLFVAFQTLIATAIDLWEPRFAVRRIIVQGSVDGLRLGQARFSIEVDYRPRGHLGDETVERVLTFGLTFGREGARILA